MRQSEKKILKQDLFIAVCVLTVFVWMCVNLLSKAY